MKRVPLHFQILIALILAVLCGVLFGPSAKIGPLVLVDIYDFVGAIFLNALKMLIVPLVASSIISSIAGLNSVKGFGRLGWKTLSYYLVTSLFAIVTGLVLVNAIAPGRVEGTSQIIEANSAAAAVKLQQLGDRGFGDLAQVFIDLIPPNVVSAAASGNLLGLIFFCLLFGYFITKLTPHLKETAVNIWQGIYQVMLKITDLVMKFAPIGVFALVAKVFATTGVEIFAQLAKFALTVLLALGIHSLLTLPLLLMLIGRVRPRLHFRAMFPAMLTAFSTASSSATLPLTMDCVEKRSGVSNRVTSFVLPLGATINMDGTALYECVAAIFMAQALGIEMTFAQQFTIVLLALMTSIGVAGIPQASTVAILVIMKAVGIPLEAIGLLFATDRILDMCRTAVNIFSDSCGAVIIGRSEGETQILSAAIATEK